MSQPLDAARMGEEAVNNGLKSVAGVAKSMQVIAAETTEFSRKSLEKSGDAVGKLISAGTIDRAFEIQSAYAREVYEGLVAQASRMNELYADLAKEAYRPFETIGLKRR